MYTKICNVYSEEKAKALGRKVLMIEDIQRLSGKGERWLKRRVFSKLPKCESLERFSEIYYSTHRSSLRRLEHMNLRARKIYQ